LEKPGKCRAFYVQDYVQDKVRPGTGREGALGYERYIAIEHMDVRRDCVSFAQRLATCMGAKAAQYLASGRAVMFRMNGTLR